jgi:aspartyl-tRNA(Asn)/glutamyl-tRNA(Gln) amidotransferase subunit B
MDTYTPVVGMEIHVELATASKMFCGCRNDPFGAGTPNIYTCPVCLGMPGALPVPNRKAVEWTILLGLALECTITKLSKFDRKNYFYPDLAKGYQISQYDMPLCTGGVVHLPEGDVRINRVHLEEDTGKLQHTKLDGREVTLVDFNRSGVPLVEIVTEPDITSSDQAKAFVKKLHQIVRFIGISHADLEKGSMRLEPNISVRKPGETGLPPYKVEVKNINSFSYVKKAIDFEVARHTDMLKRGETPKQETRGFVEDRGVTLSQRSKEDAMDYRYFPEPDIPPMRFTDADIQRIRAGMPELPDTAAERLRTGYGLTEADIAVLAETREKLDQFEATFEKAKTDAPSLTPKAIANYLINKKIDAAVDPADIISALNAQAALSACPPEEINAAAAKVVAANPKAVADYKSGKTTVIMFLLGMVKRELKGRGDAKAIEDALKEKMA